MKKTVRKNYFKFPKRIISLIMSVCILLSVAILAPLETKAVEVVGYTPISNKEDFYNIRNNTNGKYYLTDDIVFDEWDYTALGDYYGGFDSFNDFYGTIDGCGHTIYGLKGECGIANYNYGIVKNLEFKECEFEIAGIARRNSGEIINCKVSDSTIDYYGIAYYNYESGIVKYCSVADCTIKGDAGVVGYNEGIIDYCVNKSDIIKENSTVGGIALDNANGAKITNCINYAEISVGSGSASGISLRNGGTIENCVNHGKVSVKSSNSYYMAAGISAHTANSYATNRYIQNCLNTGVISAGYTKAAFGIASSYAGQVIKSINIGTVNNGSGYAIIDATANAVYSYYLNNTGIAPGTSFTNAQLDQSKFSGFDFDNVWKLEDNILSLRCEDEFQTDITCYQYPEKTKYWRGNELDLSDMIVFSLNSLGTWEQLYSDKYTVDGYDSTILGKQTVTVKNNNNSFSFNVYVYDKIANQNITITPSAFEYSSEYCKPSVKITDCTTKRKLTLGKDYKIEYLNNLNVGTATVKITGLGYYDSSITKTFEIVPKDISDSTISTASEKYTYTGEAIKPFVDVTIEGVELVNGVDYTVYYKNNKNIGTGTITINGKGNYTGTIERNFEIVPKDINVSTVSTASEKYTYTGEAIEPSVDVTVEGVELVNGIDYTVSYKNNINVGTGTITINGKGNYTGTIEKTFKISAIQASKATVKLSATAYTFNHKVKTPTVTVKDSAGNILEKDTDYTVSYPKGRKNVGKYKIVVTFKGNYSGTKELYFTINPVKTSVSKLTAGKKSIKVYVGKKTSQVTGYQIQYSAYKNFKSAKTKTLTSYKSTSTTLKLSRSRRIYYVRVRTYKTVNGVRYYSGWSTYKYAKTK